MHAYTDISLTKYIYMNIFICTCIYISKKTYLQFLGYLISSVTHFGIISHLLIFILVNHLILCPDCRSRGESKGKNRVGIRRRSVLDGQTGDPSLNGDSLFLFAFHCLLLFIYVCINMDVYASLYVNISMCIYLYVFMYDGSM
jgi:hypothetical protein